MWFKVAIVLVVACIAISAGRKKKTTTPNVVPDEEVLLAVAESRCSLSLKNFMVKDREPLLLDVKRVAMRESREVQKLDIARPEVENGKDGVLNLENKEELMVVCTGLKNSVADSGEESVYVKCDDGELTMRDGSKVTKESMACVKSDAFSWIKVTEEKCGKGVNSGVMVQLGFQLNDGSWFPEVDLCHNITLGHTYWASHLIYGRSIRGSVKSNKRRMFSRGSKKLYPLISPERLYPQESQKAALAEILGASQSARYMTKDFLARGHLAPDADFIFHSEQLMTYYFANAAPQWQTFNAGNWLTVENTVRDLAAKTGLTLNVYTGTYGILKLADASNDDQPIYLYPKKKMIPVPEVFWKVVQHPVTKSCTVAVGHNNVFLKEAPTPICTKTLPDGWPKNNLEVFEKGYSYYCDYQSFSKTVDYEPDIECKDLFEFPEIR